ncbi:hypothetical protein FIE12Z_11803 [Fusarium flagelliforme]|uniref:Rik1-associated factor 1 n=1 Tax=Fusarium flagelliforme TaxID=2675880 RepID=A0A395M7X0_9HYPO|nr:hypothetical protein FIE12Z_11803 [Fusarium flagelliforme]
MLLYHLITSTTPNGAMGSIDNRGRVPTAPIPLLHSLARTGNEPPHKRRRVEKRSVKECLQQQIRPLVSSAVERLPREVYHINALAIKVVNKMVLVAKGLGEDLVTRAWDCLFANVYCKEFRVAPLASPTPPARQLHRATRVATPPREQTEESYSSESGEFDVEGKDRPKGESEPESDELRGPEEVEEPRSTLQQPTRPRESKPPTFFFAPELPKAPETEISQHVQRRPYKPRERREPNPQNRFYQLTKKPYITAEYRNAIKAGTRQPVNINSTELPLQPVVYHVDFSPDEIAQITEQLSQYKNERLAPTLETLTRCVRLGTLPASSGRSHRDMNAFAADLWAGQVAEVPRVLSFTGEPVSEQTKKREGQLRRASRFSSLLLAREMSGNQVFQRTRQYLNFREEFKTLREDDLEVVAEFTNCAGDITTGAWVSNESFICGTTTHSDTHNQQYNKPGNLLLCSTAKGTLRAFPDHRIPRPRVEKGENSTEAMRQSQDPWLYSSVVSSDYNEQDDLAYTSGFDKTVKVWKVDSKGPHMEAITTWQHTGNVNFVAAAKDRSGRVATAADSPTDAVRIYTIERGNEANSTYQTFSCSRKDAEGSDKWAYFPATMQWGRAPGCQHLLLVGYSPRSLTGDDQDIPEDKKTSGEIILWNAEENKQIPVFTASTANVFEVAWHPTLQRFIVATTPTGLSVNIHKIRTQVHIFQRDKERLGGTGFAQFQALDCCASDINELTFVPNSPGHAYVSAACTDGKVYVWDTARGDKPIHTLRHGKPIEEYCGDREKEDTGIKFTAWNTSLDRFYTGSSDGVVKVWNIRRSNEPFVRDILTAPGPIAWGGFSPNNSKLAIGDATGRCFILSIDARDAPESHFMTLPGTTRRLRRPQPLLLHPEPAPPGADEDGMDTDTELDDASYARRTYLDTRCLRLSHNPVIGAVQGPEYASSNLFRLDAHLNEDPTAPLLADFERLQKDSEAASIGRRRRSVRRVKIPPPPDERLKAVHSENKKQDFDSEQLDRGEMNDLVKAGALLNIEEDWGFIYEETMSLDDADTY